MKWMLVALLACGTCGAFEIKDGPLPRPFPVICFDAPFVCFDTALEIDTVMDYSPNPRLYGWWSGPGPLVLGYHDQGVFIEVFRSYYATRTQDVGRLILVGADDDLIFTDPEIDVIYRWSAFPLLRDQLPPAT